MIDSLSLENFKGATATYKFATGNLIQGRNFSGKSAIDQAIRMLVLGYIPDQAKTAAALKSFASAYPMRIEAAIEPCLYGVTFEQVKSKITQTRNDLFTADEHTRVLFDPTLFFGLTDNMRIAKACELVQSVGGSLDEIAHAIAAVIGVDLTPGKTITKEEDFWSKFDAWRREVKAKAATVNDLLAQSDVYWKDVRKQFNSEKERMQKTVEGMTDMNTLDAEAAKLPQRSEVEARKAELFAEIQALAGQIQNNKTIAEAYWARRKRIAELTASVGNLSAFETGVRASTQVVMAVQSEVETLQSNAHTAFTNLKVARASADGHATRQRNVNALKPHAAREAFLVEAVAVKEHEVHALEESLDPLREKIQTAKVALAEAQTEAEAPRQAASSRNVYIDDFREYAAIGERYRVTAVVTRVSSEETTIEQIESWSPVVPPAATESAKEDSSLHEYERLQQLTEAKDVFYQACDELSQATNAVKEARIALQNLKTDFWKSQNAVEMLKQLEAETSDAAPSTPEEINRLSDEYNTLNDTLKLKQGKLQAANDNLRQAKEQLSKCTYDATELQRLDSEAIVAPSSDAEISALSKEHEIKTASLKAADETIHAIIRFDQDRKRVEDAANQRTKVEASIKTVGKVIDLLAQKKVEIVSGSIEPPLAIANKLGAGILKGLLVFEEGEIGMRVDGAFISSRTFSGTESAIVMMGLTAGLASRSSLRVLMLDEIGRLDTENAARLILNLAGMVNDGDIDQYIVLGPTNPELALWIAPMIDQGGINVINV